MRCLVRLLAATLGAMAIALSSPGGGVALSCVQHSDVERAAREALAGDHPSWADAYTVGRVDGIERPMHAPTMLTVTPTHVFAGDLSDRIRLAARSDGPPDPSSWQVGGYYFLALADSPELEGVAGLVAPCAPNFRITATDQLDRLVRAAPEVRVREAVLSLSSSGPHLGIAAVLGAASVIGLGSWLSFRRHPPRGHRP